VVVPFGNLLAASIASMALDSPRSRSSIGITRITIGQFGLCILTPSKASFQSIVQSCSACSSVSHRARRPLVSC
jgi:hypothetical protein